MMVDLEGIETFQCKVCPYLTNSESKFRQHQLGHSLSPAVHPEPPLYVGKSEELYDAGIL